MKVNARPERKISHVKILFPEKRETNREVMVEKHN